MEIPKTQKNIKLFELKKDSLSEEKEGQKNPSDSLKMEILQTAERSKKKKKRFQKAWRWAQSIPRLPWQRWWQGEFSLNILTSSTQEIESEVCCRENYLFYPRFHHYDALRREDTKQYFEKLQRKYHPFARGINGNAHRAENNSKIFLWLKP